MSTSMTRKQRQDKLSWLGRNADTVHKLLFEEVLIGKIEAIMQRKDVNLDDLIHFSNMEAYSELRELEKKANEKFEKRVEEVKEWVRRPREIVRKLICTWK